MCNYKFLKYYLKYLWMRQICNITTDTRWYMKATMLKIIIKYALRIMHVSSKGWHTMACWGNHTSFFQPLPLIPMICAWPLALLSQQLQDLRQDRGKQGLWYTCMLNCSKIPLPFFPLQKRKVHPESKLFLGKKIIKNIKIY